MSTNQTYTVQPGDTLALSAQKFYGDGTINSGQYSVYQP
jgi:nucleoid-associated protein YgaU